jgi:hypothetical protein
MGAFDEIRDTPGAAGHIDLLGILAVHMDALPPEVWALTDPLIELVMSGSPAATLSCAYLFHNLMLKQPEEALKYFDRLVTLGEIVLQLSQARPEPIAVYLSALFRIAQPSALPISLV